MEIQHPAGDNGILPVPWVESTGRCGANNLPRLESYFSISGRCLLTTGLVFSKSHNFAVQE